MTRQCRGCGATFPARPRHVYCWRCYNRLHPRRTPATPRAKAKAKPQEMPGWRVVRFVGKWVARKAGWSRAW